LGQIFNFSDIEKSEKSIKRTWQEFRNALSRGEFSFDDIASAKKNTFLKVYDDLFNKNAGIEYNTVLVSKLENYCVGRGTILGEDENPDFERFIPQKEFIKSDNRFSPTGVEWLYLAIGEEAEIHECAQAECRAKLNDRFGFCHFKFTASSTSLKLVDLTIANETTYEALNDSLETYGQKQVMSGIKKAKASGFIPRNEVNVEEFKKLFTKWAVYTYSKLLSEQIFEPLDENDDNSLIYSPFQTMAQYYISLGYAGIIYGSTVSTTGKNIVLFDKTRAHPTGTIEDYRIT
jgi:RES domain-containing protein